MADILNVVQRWKADIAKAQAQYALASAASPGRYSVPGDDVMALFAGLSVVLADAEIELARLRAVEAERDRLREAVHVTTKQIRRVLADLDAGRVDWPARRKQMAEALDVSARALASTGQEPTPAPTQQDDR